jgi:hypothetical protein
MKFQLYLSEKCSECVQLASEYLFYLEKVEVIWLTDHNTKPDTPLILPCLKSKAIILSYGSESIVQYFQRIDSTLISKLQTI